MNPLLALFLQIRIFLLLGRILEKCQIHEYFYKLLVQSTYIAHKLEIVIVDLLAVDSRDNQSRSNRDNTEFHGF